MKLSTTPEIQQNYMNFDKTEFLAQTVTLNHLETENDEDFFHNIPESCQILIFPIKVCDVLTSEDDIYNEEYLSQLRKFFKNIEKTSLKVLFLPQIQDNLLSLPEQTIKSMKHTARRLKKFESIMGFVLPQEDCFKNEKVRQEFISELSEKHEHYKFVDLV